MYVWLYIYSGSGFRSRSDGAMEWDDTISEQWFDLILSILSNLWRIRGPIYIYDSKHLVNLLQTNPKKIIKNDRIGGHAGKSEWFHKKSTKSFLSFVRSFVDSFVLVEDDIYPIIYDLYSDSDSRLHLVNSNLSLYHFLQLYVSTLSDVGIHFIAIPKHFSSYDYHMSAVPVWPFVYFFFNRLTVCHLMYSSCNISCVWKWVAIVAKSIAL